MTPGGERGAGGPREQRFVFGEVAEQYDRTRPAYPDAVFDTVMAYGGLRPGDRALEIGAGTGKATVGFTRRGLDVLALEPSAAMASVLRDKGVDVVESTLEDWAPPAGAFRLCFAAQSWHWVTGEDRWHKLAQALEAGGAVALFWNRGRPHTEPFKSDNDAVYARLAPHMSSSISGWSADGLVEGISGCEAFGPLVCETVTWTCSYTTEEWIRLLATHSTHRMLPDDVRAELHAGVAAAIGAHGGAVEVVYDTLCFMALRG